MKFKNVGVQALASDIDEDLMAELTFYKRETARVQGELNTNRIKMMANEKVVKTANKKERDANTGIEVLEKQLREARGEGERDKNL